ncbi:hypothetical protein BROUX41_001951 [Berkeleyomyces rouxiae]|uniref:uncharacterized protein n=1 Tax=Berkeleyomyces rouxiae TaxID=2035830 RepID=UPI003B7F52E9
MNAPAAFSGTSSAAAAAISGLSWPLNPSTTSRPFDAPPPNQPAKDWSQIIGIATAISGNVLIALALNVQRYAHLKLHEKRAQMKAQAQRTDRRAKLQAAREHHRHNEPHDRENPHHRPQDFPRLSTVTSNENDCATAARRGTSDVGFSGYGAIPTVHFPSPPLSRTVSAAYSPRASYESERPAGEDPSPSPSPSEKDASLSYLHSPYWWLGQVLIILGEMGNFLAYGFAPASIVSPLGVVALVSNCVIAPILFHERFRARDAWGVMTAVAGVVVVVMSAGGDESKLGPHDVWDAITAPAFEIYLCVTIAMIATLMWASRRYGKRTILIDLGLVGLFGGYTALATKGVSSMLSSALLRAFQTPVTYALLLVLIVTAIMQIRYLNRALQRFDSTQVIPIQFVMFTLCVIVGSAVLYQDFERTTLVQSVKFISGCLLTFFGVFLITSDRPRPGDEESRGLEADGMDETIGLMSHEAYADASPSHTPRSSFSSQRPSQSEFPILSTERRISITHETSVPSSRAQEPLQATVTDHQQHHSDFHNWTEEASGPPPPRPDPTPLQHCLVPEYQPVSTMSEPPATAMFEPSTPPATSHGPSNGTTDPFTVTPTRWASGGRRFPGPVISASPFSSAVSAVITDSLRHKTRLARRTSLGRLWSSIRAGMFMDDEDGSEGGESSGLGSRQPLLGPLFETAESTVPPRPSTSRERSFKDPAIKRQRHRSLSDTLNGLIKPSRGYVDSMYDATPRRQ